MREVTGISGAGPIWHDFMREVLLGQPELTFTRPEGLIRVEVCALSGLLPTGACPQRVREWFIPGTEPTAYDTLHQVFTIDRRTGLLADDSTPAEERIEQVFLVLPQEARDWAARQGIPAPPGAAATAPDAYAGLRLLEPDPYTTFRLSSTLPPEAQRLRLTAGVSPGTRRVTYLMDGVPVGSAEAAPWVVWWLLQPGQHELVAEAVLADGSTERSTPIPFTVSAFVPAEERPPAGQLP